MKTLQKMLMGLMMFMVVMVIMVSGCTHNKSLLNDEGISTQTNTANLVRLKTDGSMEATGNGAGPSVVNVDPEGIYTGQAVPLGVLHFSMPNFIDPNGKPMQAHITSPEDVEIGEATFAFAPATGEITITLKNLSANKSNVIAEQVKALQVALTILDSMTKTEAEAAVEKWKIAGTFGSDALEVLKTFIGLKFPVTVETTTPTTE